MRSPMFGDGPLTFREFATREPLPLARVHDAVLGFLRTREDAVLCGAHAVNAYVDEARMTQDVDVLSPRAAELARELSGFLSERFDITIRVLTLRKGTLYRLFQKRKRKSRQLVDVYLVGSLPPHQRVKRVAVLTPPVLICSKVLSMANRRRTPKGGIDHADLARLLLAFPELKKEEGAVAECL